MKMLRDPYMVSEFAREMAGKALMYPYNFWNNMLDFAKMKREIREALKKAGHLSMAETDDMVAIFVLYHDDPAVDLQKVFWENKVLCVSGADFAGMELIHARLIRKTTCSNGCKCDYTICGDKDPYCREHPEYRGAQGYSRNR